MTTITATRPPIAAPAADRAVLLVEIGRGGATVFYRRCYTADGYTDSRLSGYESSEGVRQAIAAGAALIDTRPMSFRDACDFAIKGPMLDQSDGAEPDRLFGEPTPGQGLDGCGYGSFQRAPLAVIARLAEARGAYVRNIPEEA